MSTLAIADNKKIVDLGKVLHAEFYYKNQHGQRIGELWNFKTAKNYRLVTDKDEESAKRLNLIDKWTPHVRLKLLGNSELVFIGDKAKSVYKEWCSRQFGRKQKEQKELTVCQD